MCGQCGAIELNTVNVELFLAQGRFANVLLHFPWSTNKEKDTYWDNNLLQRQRWVLESRKMLACSGGVEKKDEEEDDDVSLFRQSERDICRENCRQNGSSALRKLLFVEVA